MDNRKYSLRVEECAKVLDQYWDTEMHADVLPALMAAAVEIADERWDAEQALRAEYDYFNGPIWSWFGLSYCSYMVIPRAVLCSMPVEWQKKMVDLINQVPKTLDWPEDDDYTVQLRDERGRFKTDPLANYKYQTDVVRKER